MMATARKTCSNILISKVYVKLQPQTNKLCFNGIADVINAAVQTNEMMCLAYVDLGKFTNVGIVSLMSGQLIMSSFQTAQGHAFQDQQGLLRAYSSMGGNNLYKDCLTDMQYFHETCSHCIEYKRTHSPNALKGDLLSL